MTLYIKNDDRRMIIYAPKSKRFSDILEALINYKFEYFSDLTNLLKRTVDNRLILAGLEKA